MLAEGEEGDGLEGVAAGEEGGSLPVVGLLQADGLQVDLARVAGGAEHLSEGEEELVITLPPTISPSESLRLK